jgi:hypothetical protein
MGQKASVRNTVGGMEENTYPHSRQVKSWHFTTPNMPKYYTFKNLHASPAWANCLCSVVFVKASSRYLILQSRLNRLSLLTTFFASKAVACKKKKALSLKLLLHIRMNNSKRCTYGHCCRVERAASMWPTTHFRPLSAVWIGLFLSSCKQFNTAMPKPS